MSVKRIASESQHFHIQDSIFSIVYLFWPYLSSGVWLKAIHQCMTDKLKTREIFVCPVNYPFYCVNRNLRETTKWPVCVSRVDLDQ